MLDRTEVDVIELRIDDIYRAGAVCTTAALGNSFLSQTWAELNRAHFQALWLEKMSATQSQSASS